MGILDLESNHHSQVLRWAGHATRVPMSRAPRQLLTVWVAHPLRIGCQEINLCRTLKKALKRNALHRDFVTWRAIDCGRPRWRLLAHSTPTPSPPTPNPSTPSTPTPSPTTPYQPPANPNAPLSGKADFSYFCVKILRKVIEHTYFDFEFLGYSAFPQGGLYGVFDYACACTN